MEVLDARERLLTNCEVLHLVIDVRAGEQRRTKTERASDPNHGLSTIVYQTIKYLNESAIHSKQVETSIRHFIDAIRIYKLTIAETIQLINLRPTSAVEIQLIVEECEDRLSEQQVDAIAQLVDQHFPIITADVDVKE